MADPKAAAEALKAQGNAHFAARKWPAALAAFSEAIALDPSNHVLFSNRCACLLEIGNLPAAEEDARRCIAANPAWAKGQYRLACVLEARGDAAGALAAVTEGLRLDPSSSDMGKMKARLTAAAAGSAAGEEASAPSGAAVGPRAPLSMAAIAAAATREVDVIALAATAPPLTAFSAPHAASVTVVDDDGGRGRGLQAARDFSPGDEVLVERAIAWYPNPWGDAISSAVPALMHVSPLAIPPASGAAAGASAAAVDPDAVFTLLAPVAAGSVPAGAGAASAVPSSSSGAATAADGGAAATAAAPSPPVSASAPASFPRLAADVPARLPRGALIGRVARANALAVNWMEGPGGTGSVGVLGVMVSLINHSCDANARVVCEWAKPDAAAGTGDKAAASAGSVAAVVGSPVLRVIAVKPITVGQPIEVCYVSPTASKQERGASLRRHGVHACGCPRCAAAYDDTCVAKCPKCLAGRAYIGADTCADCGADVKEQAADGGPLEILRRQYLAKPRQLPQALEEGGVGGAAGTPVTPVHLADASRLAIVFNQLYAAWVMPPAEALAVYGRLLPVMESTGCQWLTSLPQMYLLAGHCAVAAGDDATAAERYERAAALYGRVYGAGHFYSRVARSIASKPPRTRAEVERVESVRATFSWVTACGMPRGMEQALLAPVMPAAGDLLKSRRTPDGTSPADAAAREAVMAIAVANARGEWPVAPPAVAGPGAASA